ncbi:MAG TPA: hypothetical protein VFG84_05930 [Gemmatimonadaceae bacterium]|nr:hypothetical protein [Gemmatimonadaceae bacterium]
MSARLLGALLTVTLVLVPASNAHAQRERHARTELRTDVFVARRPTVHLGVGVAIPVTTYMRVAGIAAGGAVSTDGTSEPAARGELLARFVLDPLGERRWGLYGAAGVGAFWDNEIAWRGRLLLSAGIEGRLQGAWTPALEVGLGEGLRIGVVMRRRAGLVR